MRDGNSNKSCGVTPGPSQQLTESNNCWSPWASQVFQLCVGTAIRCRSRPGPYHERRILWPICLPRNVGVTFWGVLEFFSMAEKPFFATRD